MTDIRPQPTEDEREDLLLSCRYGDRQDVQDFVAKFGAEALPDIQDDNENTILHMVCGNGHTDVLELLLPLVHSSLLIKPNRAGSTPLHWAAVNKHIEVAQKLVQYRGGPGVEMIDIKNTAGRSPLGEAEMAGWDDGARWFVQVMNLDEAKEEEDVSVEPSQAIEVEIQDADGQVARMTINPKTSEPTADPS